MSNSTLRYSRQVCLSEIGEEGQERIRNSTVVILGLGALGSTVANILSRAGVGNLRLVDRDFVELSNLQRQGIYDEEDVKKNLPKAVAAKNHLAEINSEITYEALVMDVNPGNVEKIIRDATVVVDGLDNYYTRALVNQACVKLGIPWVHGACISTYGTVMTLIPGKTPCYECFVPGAGERTSPYTCDTVGVFGPVAFLVASWEASEALKIAAGNGDSVLGNLIWIDLWGNRVTPISINRNSDCPVCARREFPLLEKREPIMTSSVCGKNAVQVVPGLDKFDFDVRREVLSRTFPLEVNDYLLKFNAGDYEIVLFRDGRAMVFGTTDQNVAKSLYTRYIGG